MNLEGVIICVGYADFLAWTLPYNKTLFNRLVVVTDTKDKETKNLCEHLHIECVQTDVFYENGDKFNKAKGINAGLARLGKSDWVIHMDADIYLPPQTRNILENIIPDMPKDHIYGIDRMMCPTYEEWINFMDAPRPIHEGWVYIHTNRFPIGVRIAEYTKKGWEPIGFFQMWNPKASNVFSYPDKHGAADRTDVQFAKFWPREKRTFLPEVLSVHLDSENLDTKEMGKNWNGRKTAPFTLKATIDSKVQAALGNLPVKEETPVTVKQYKPNWFVRLVNRIFSLFACKDYNGKK